MASAEEVTKGMLKKYGEGVVSQGVKYSKYSRAASGIFSLDLATGGGFPEGKTTIIYGPEASLKTTVTLLAIAQMQRAHPERKNVFVDVENSYDAERAAQLGVDNDALIYVLPDYAEQVVDIVEAYLYTDDIGIVAVDSLAAMATQNETESSAEKMIVGGSGLVIGRLYRKTTLALSRARRAGVFPTVVMINQIRFKIGTMHGDPETMPGGQAFKYASALTLRLYGKNVIDKTIHPTMACWNECSGIIKKYKCGIVQRNFEFKMAIIPHSGLRVGQVYEWNTVVKNLKDTGLLTPDKKSKLWLLFGEGYKTQTLIKDRMMEDFDFSMRVKTAIVEKVTITDDGQTDDEYVEDDDI